jgi:hypothetical protein
MELPKNTRLESKIKNVDPHEYLKARPSSTPYPINSTMPMYTDRHFVNSRDLNVNPRNLPVQINNQLDNKHDSNIQFNYFINNFETLNSQKPKEVDDNKYLEYNPVNTRYNSFTNERKQELNNFRNIQGGVINNYTDYIPLNTRKDKNSVNTNSYVPNSKILAIPKENI